MKIIDMHCPACGAILDIRRGASSVTCEYCDSTFALDADEDGRPDKGDDLMDEFEEDVDP